MINASNGLDRPTGRNFRRPARPNSISFLHFATMRPANIARLAWSARDRPLGVRSSRGRPGHRYRKRKGIRHPTAVTCAIGLGAFINLPIRGLDEMTLGARICARSENNPARVGQHRTRREASMDVIIYHNPDCGTSRNTLAMISE